MLLYERRNSCEFSASLAPPTWKEESRRNEFFRYTVTNFITIEDKNCDLMYGILFRARTSSSKPHFQDRDR
ncbi:hypothetical protein P5673_006923 [Acropora cervicornis]|uniref:Uncharacterized protein n=1 Tax=Acropora cervicornis TaxID=6130 RepID=A0AAD9QXG3_ACRCE|nr:hypothetical protein P5673_006923 [Acropora cervicornis]